MISLCDFSGAFIPASYIQTSWSSDRNGGRVGKGGAPWEVEMNEVQELGSESPPHPISHLLSSSQSVSSATAPWAPPTVP